MRLSSQTISVATAISPNYVLPLLVALHSARRFLRKSWHLDLYLVHRGLPAVMLDAIRSAVTVHPVFANEVQLAALPHDASYPRESAFPLLLPEVLPADVERVLFVDADVLVLDDLALLWEQELGGRSTGAVVDVAVPRCGSPRGVKSLPEFPVEPEAPYFNAGILLMDLPRWRRTELAAKALRYLRTVGNDADYFHQEALNAVLAGDWHPLPSRWNLPGDLTGRFPQPYSPPPGEKPGVIHYSGRFKPWLCRLGGQYGKLYRQFLEEVLAAVPALSCQAEPNWKHHCLGFYSRYLRTPLYRLEHNLWERRWI